MLTIIFVSSVYDLTDFQSLTQLGSLEITETNLNSLNGLQNITELNNLFIYGNPELTNLEGLNNLTYVGEYMNLKTNVSEINALQNLEHVGEVLTLNGLNINNIDALENLNYLGGLEINNETSNIQLSDLSGISHLTEIHGSIWLRNTLVTDFNDFVNYDLIEGGIFLTDNELLNDISG